tara:strand:+ start:6719 stop:7153 length:435 start_codon:yes stop_codon:yes gene_type:complete
MVRGKPAGGTRRILGPDGKWWPCKAAPLKNRKIGSRPKLPKRPKKTVSWGSNTIIPKKMPTIKRPSPADLKRSLEKLRPLLFNDGFIPSTGTIMSGSSDGFTPSTGTIMSGSLGDRDPGMTLRSGRSKGMRLSKPKKRNRKKGR